MIVLDGVEYIKTPYGKFCTEAPCEVWYRKQEGVVGEDSEEGRKGA